MRTMIIGTVGALAMSVWLHAGAPAATTVADAAMSHDADAVRALLKQGGDVNAAQGDGMTALHWAAMHGDAALADTLLFAGGNARATTRLGGYTPLHLASQNGATAVIDALVGRGADVDARATTGQTALMFGAAADRADVVRVLLEHGANAALTSKMVDLSGIVAPEDKLQQ